MADPRLLRLLRWFAKHKRRLPWRNTRDSYRIYISEIMLQQTQVPRVLEHYRAWLRRFPSWKALAKARTDDILRAWAGLGYNRRALHARDAARHVLRHGVPKTLEEWMRLKGAGSYTARAAYAIVSRKPVLAIDTNVRRAAGRIFLGIPYPSPENDARIEKVLAKAGFGAPSHWALAQAFMDFGTAICRSKPNCGACPFAADCMAAQEFLSGSAAKPKPRRAETVRAGKRYPDRIYRGRIVEILRTQQYADLRTIGANIDPSYCHAHDAAWITNMANRLVKDGLIGRRGFRIFLAME